MTQPIISDDGTNNPGRPTATIIAFPARPRLEPKARDLLPQLLPAESLGSDASPQERLARALAKLNAALTEQRAAVAEWRSALGELKTATAQLDNSLHLYRSNLRSLSGRVTSLNTKAKALEQWADNVIKK